MNYKKITISGAMTLLVICSFWACTNKKRGPALNVNLYTGIRNVVSLGDTEAQVLGKVKYSHTRQELKGDSKSKNFSALKITSLIDFKEIGTKVYFRRNRVVLIEIQDPFYGIIQGKKITLFSFEAPKGKSWDKVLSRQFGSPKTRASGGRLGSEGLFYSWGDISFNRMGPNQLALYRDTMISQYRQRNFGRELSMIK